MEVLGSTFKKMKKVSVRIYSHNTEITFQCKKCKHTWSHMCYDKKSGEVEIWDEYLECPDGCNESAIKKIERDSKASTKPESTSYTYYIEW